MEQVNSEKPWITRWTTIVGAILAAPMALMVGIELLGLAPFLIVVLLAAILGILINISRKLRG